MTFADFQATPAFCDDLGARIQDAAGMASR